jgi:hypothetical protein
VHACLPVAAFPTRSSAYFPAVHQESPVFDPALHELAATLNTLVSDTESPEKQQGDQGSRQRAGIAVTGGRHLWGTFGPRAVMQSRDR